MNKPSVEDNAPLDEEGQVTGAQDGAPEPLGESLELPPVDVVRAPQGQSLGKGPSTPGPLAHGTLGPDAKRFRPSRGLHPLAFGLPALVFVGLNIAVEAGVIAPQSLGLEEALVGPLMLGLGALFGGVFAWTLGRRSRTDDEAALVYMIAGEAGEPLMLTNAEGRILYANQGFRTLFQSNAAAEIPNALRFFEHDGDAPVAVKRMMNAASGGAKDRSELAFNKHGGGTHWWQLNARPAGKRTSGLVCWTARDVTARRELDEVRRAEEALLADLLDNLPVGFFSVDGTGRMVYANETLCSWLGIELSDIRDQGIGFAEFVTELIANDDPDDNGDNGQVTLQPRDGDAFKAFLLQSGRMSDGGELLYTRSIVVRDLVKKQPALQTAVSAHPGDDEDLTDIARRLYWLFDEAPVAIALLDMKANITDANGAFFKMLGLHRDNVLGLPFSERLVKEDRGDVGGQLSKVVMGIMRAAHIEVRMPAVGGREVTASLYASRMEDAFGEVTGLIVHFIDTTEHKHLEVQFAQSQKMQSIGQLAGGIAHDFNNLLTAMIGFSDLLLTRHGPDDPSFNDINQIRQNAVRATSLVRQLLAFSRKQTLEPQRVDAKEKLSELSEVLSRLIGPTIELNIEHSRDLGYIRVDPTQFDQVILNLSVNARDAMPGGGTLTIRTSNMSLNEPTQRGMELVPAGDYICLDVIDTGEGIRKEDIGRIFEPFFSTKEVGEGTGLGLSTVYGIVHQTGGHVFVDSAPGEGAAFTVCLPRYIEDVVSDVHTGRLEKAHRKSDLSGQDAEPQLKAERDGGDGDFTGVGTILLVEDEDAVRMFGSRALTNKGYTVLEAANGEEALEVINATDQKIDLIVTDVVMPGMDGHTLVQFVRQEMPDMKVILISGFAENVIPGGIQSNSGFAFLPKPFSLKDLAAKVKSVLAE
ncbi:hybrid sensor histidine kinase/response regulator [Magnetovibrio blakemorei]|uniref:hybrid sensor histidine kinase/response regulator n=1 Tax=Magnetovibrio blakemorei TaxID=28181 RepID=UPI000AF04831|nr:PAS domain-containing sensor histidine kinase [Magnetovibrio blakemorei]